MMIINYAKLAAKKLLYSIYRIQYWKNKIGFQHNANENHCREKLNNVYIEKEYGLMSPLKSVDGGIEVSIIVPVYNAEKYIGSCLDNILGQATNIKYEIICIDDGSTDKSWSILQQYEHIPNVTIIHQQNQGVSAARNVGIEVSKGKYICFVDNDDYIHSDFLNLMVKKIEETDSDIVKGNYSIALDGKKVLYKPLNENNYLFDGFCWGTLYKREIWERVRFPIGYWYEDMIVRMLVFRMTGKIAFLDEEIYTKNDRSDSEGKKQGGKKNTDYRCLDHVFLINKIIDILAELNIKNDEYLISLLLDEMGEIMYGRIKGLPADIMCAAFELACDLYVRSFEMAEVKCCRENEIHNILLEGNFKAWVYYCKAQRIKS